VLYSCHLILPGNGMLMIKVTVVELKERIALI
jgi:hypothetical protein